MCLTQAYINYGRFGAQGRTHKPDLSQYVLPQVTQSWNKQTRAFHNIWWPRGTYRIKWITTHQTRQFFYTTHVVPSLPPPMLPPWSVQGWWWCHHWQEILWPIIAMHCSRWSCWFDAGCLDNPRLWGRMHGSLLGGLMPAEGTEFSAKCNLWLWPETINDSLDDSVFQISNKSFGENGLWWVNLPLNGCWQDIHIKWLFNDTKRRTTIAWWVSR